MSETRPLALVPSVSDPYTLRVNGPLSPSGDGGQPAKANTTRRRRLPNQQEHARRQAWGREWAQVMKDHAAEKGWK